MHPANSQLCVSTIVRHSAAATLKFIFEFVCVLVAQSCLTLCNPIGYSLPGSSIHGILQARILEWVVIPFSGGSSQPRTQTKVSCIAGRFFTVLATELVKVKVAQSWLTLCDSIDYTVHRIL